MMKQIDIQKLRPQMQAEIRQMQTDIQQLENKIKTMKSQEKRKRLRSIAVFTPFIKALLLTAVILLIYTQFGIN
jgi:hypothetical protein